MGLFDTGENNVGQFGADDSNIIRYKQAAEYAEDARLYALAAADALVDADNILNRADQLLNKAKDILDSVKDIETNVEKLEIRVSAAEAVANEAVAKAQQAIDDAAAVVQKAEAAATRSEGFAIQADGARQAAESFSNSAQAASVEAKGYRDEADGFADDAEGSVTKAETAVADATTQAEKAKAEADRAEELIANIPGKETIDGFVKVYRSLDDANTDLNERSVGDKVLIWDNGSSSYAWYNVTGSVNNLSLELDSSEKKLKTVNNVVPDDSGNVQITLPSGNPSLWLGETVLFQYDPDQPITYPGLLPQTGGEYNRRDYIDLWNAIDLGYVPSVTEAEWQAGKKNCFSTGDGSTTFRVPLWSGEALRTPNSLDEKGEISAQVPYVVSVNGISPDDATGNIELDFSSYAKKGANSDITSLSGLTTALTISQGGTGAKTSSGAKLNLGIIDQNDYPELIAHRGFGNLFPENTMIAFRSALKAGADSLETDISVTSDGVRVLMHDTTVDRTSNGTGTITSLTSSYVRGLDFGSKFSPVYAGERIPLFIDLLNFCKTKGVKVYPEIKNIRTIDDVDLIVADVVAAQMEDRTVLQGFDINNLQRVRSLNKNIAVGALFGTVPTTSDYDAIQALGNAYLLLNFSVTTAAVVTECRNRGIKLALWTVDKPKDKLAMNKLGINKLMSNYNLSGGA